MTTKNMWNRVSANLEDMRSEAGTEPFREYLSILLRERENLNLTGADTMGDLISLHLLDSLEFLRAFPGEGKRGRGIDIGSGAGFPGLPLAIACPDLEMTLADSRGKRVEFLEAVRERLGLSNVTVLAGRAESIGREPELRERFDFSVARALAPPPVAVEYCLPLVRSGGRSFLWVGPSFQQGDIARAVEELGGKPGRVHEYELSPGSRRRGIVEILKEGPTPDRYPRRPGIPRKRPLGHR
jgi:16S rRNA (guanine527-N7)-methyltransferase